MSEMKNVSEIKCSKQSLDDLGKKNRAKRGEKLGRKNWGWRFCLFVYVIS